MFLVLVLFAAFLVLATPPVHVVGQGKGFLSIDCGLDANSAGYTDRTTGIVYVPDGPYVDSGENHRVAPDLETLFDPTDRTLRSFPSGQRNCYALPTVAGTKYLLRATFAYGNYDGKSSSSLEFDLYRGPNYWRTTNPDATSSYVCPRRSSLPGRGRRRSASSTPAKARRLCPRVLELRPLDDGLYPEVTPGLILSRSARRNMGASVSIMRDLSYNNLSGPVPDSLLSLSSLRVLNVSGNQLSDGSLCKNYTGPLVFRYDSNKSTCNKKLTASNKKTVILVASVVVAVLVVSAMFLAYFIRRSKRKPTVSIDDHTRNVQIKTPPRSRTSQGDHLTDKESRRFTYKDLEKFTDNFKQFIGKGGFGVVYFGHFEYGTEVAVKMRSESSSHGLDEFLAEVQSLTKVHHRNIVSLVGYCWEKDHLALVYEYMSQGTLYDHLRGKITAVETLNWGTRVRIVLEAAQGLDYLHKGCSPPIIHRDVKSSNILLSENLQAKIADLGLSRTYISEAHTHISATAAGTAGYMDPEYYFTGRLTESSDVYSFGVVLLEAATGETPLVPGHGHISQRVKQRIASTGDIGSVADARLRGAYDVNSMWKVVDTALACTAEAGAGRPTMAEVVAQLKDSLALEDARDNNDDRSVPVSIAASDSAALMMSGFGPSAR